jgi:hypothetical protein
MVDIYDWNDLDAVRNDLTADYVLQNDLDKDTAGYSGIGDSFERIGVSGTDGPVFQGVFDGNGNMIRDLILADDGGSSRGHGVFGGLGGGGEIKKLLIDGTVDVSGFSADTSRYVGGLVGSTAVSTGPALISNCAVVVNVVSDSERVGGIVGEHRGTIENSVTVGDVTGQSEVGGAVGRNREDLNGTVKTSFSIGAVSASDSDAGGLIGDVPFGTVADAATDSFYDTQATGQTVSDGGGGLTTSEMQGDEASTNMAGFDFSAVWDEVIAETSPTVDGKVPDADGYPILQALSVAGQLDTQGIAFREPLSGIYVDGTEYDCLVDGTQYDVVQN